MVYDPYAVLGVSYDASDEEIKKAYRSQSRRYHPDANVGSPHAAQAEEKFKQVQQAYDQIMKDREQGRRGGYSSYGPGSSYSSGYGSSTGYRDPRDSYGYGPFGFGFGPFGFGGNAYGQSYQQRNPAYEGYTETEAAHLQSALNYINAGHYREAWTLLESFENHGAFWYYLAAAANSGLGNNIRATEFARTAVEMDPGNYEYQVLLQQLQGGGRWYESQSAGYGRSNLSSSICRGIGTYILCSTFCCGGSNLATGCSRMMCCC